MKFSKKVYFCQLAHKKSKMASTVFYHPCFLTISPAQRDFHESEQMYFYTDKICTYYFLWKYFFFFISYAKFWENKCRAATPTLDQLTLFQL